MLVRSILDKTIVPAVRLDAVDAAVAAGGHVVVAPHFASYADPVLFGIYIKGSPMVVIPPSVARMPWFAEAADKFDHTVVDPNDAQAEKQYADVIAANGVTVIFPEIEPTSDGVIQKMSDAAVDAIAASGACVVPAAAFGTLYHHECGRTGARFDAAKRPEIKLIAVTGHSLKSTGEAARLELERMIRLAVMESLWEHKTLFDTMLEMRDRCGADKTLSIEQDGVRVTWGETVQRVVLLSHLFSEFTAEGEHFGIMLPNTSMTFASIIAGSHAGRVPAMVNYSMGLRGTLSACGTAKVKHIVTSRRFIAQGKLEPLITGLEAGGLTMHYLEDMLASASLELKKSCAAEAASAAQMPADEAARAAERTAVVLFTSGSEGTPKAVALSHENFQSNVAQLRATIPLWHCDVAVSVLPMFHSYGLTTSVFLPMGAGMMIAFYPTPLHFKKIPQFIHEAKGSVLFGTNSFLLGWGKNADIADFAEMRIVICGGDKLQDATYDLWHKKYGIRIQEGYGVTECAPVVGVNYYSRYKRGSIGLPLPMIETSLTPVDGVHGAGRLVIKGPNVMRGYIQADGSILPPPETGYDTGDICAIDEEGYITIVGRAKRFAKIGGEMVSLAQVEEAVTEVWPDEAHAVVSVPDATRGEMIVVLTERVSPERDELRAALVKKGIPELAAPKKVAHVDAIPRIGVGKIDYQAAGKLAAELK